MLSSPVHGWSDFQLENTSAYALSHLNDIALLWIEQAIRGLETMTPFCVKGYLEPGRFLCTVSYRNCYIICEDDGSCAPGEMEAVMESSTTSMLQFCRYLYEDVNQNAEMWINFFPAGYVDTGKRRKELHHKLLQLERLIDQREACFAEGCCLL